MSELEQEVIALALYCPMTVEAHHQQLLAAARLGEARGFIRCRQVCQEEFDTGGNVQSVNAAIRALKSELP